MRLVEIFHALRDAGIFAMSNGNFFDLGEWNKGTIVVRSGMNTILIGRLYDSDDPMVKQNRHNRMELLSPCIRGQIWDKDGIAWRIDRCERFKNSDNLISIATAMIRESYGIENPKQEGMIAKLFSEPVSIGPGHKNDPDWIGPEQLYLVVEKDGKEICCMDVAEEDLGLSKEEIDSMVS